MHFACLPTHTPPWPPGPPPVPPPPPCPPAALCAAADTVRVKAVNARQEEEVSASDLPAYLLSALHPHGSGPASHAPQPGSRTPHAGGGRALASGDDGDGGGEAEEPLAHGGRERQRRGGRR